MCALSSADRVPGYEPVGQRFESSRARHKKEETAKGGLFFFIPCHFIFEPLSSACARIRFAAR